MLEAEWLEVAGLRAGWRAFYRRRNKSLPPFGNGLSGLIFAGHECLASYRRHGPQCLTRTVSAKQRHGTERRRTQYYHRLVLARLRFRGALLPLDVEWLAPGEDEVAAARRLLRRRLLRGGYLRTDSEGTTSYGEIRGYPPVDLGCAGFAVSTQTGAISACL